MRVLRALRGWIPHMVSVELLERVACAAHKVVNRLLVGHILVAQHSQAGRHHRQANPTGAMQSQSQ